MKKNLITNHKINTADVITMFRIAGTILLAFLRPLSAGFFSVYTLTGLTDALDGWIARRTKTASNFGAKLDSIADLLFYAVMLIRLFSFPAEDAAGTDLVCGGWNSLSSPECVFRSSN